MVDWFGKEIAERGTERTGKDEGYPKQQYFVQLGQVMQRSHNDDNTGGDQGTLNETQAHIIHQKITKSGAKAVRK